MTKANKVSFVVSFSKPDRASVNDCRDFLVEALGLHCALVMIDRSDVMHDLDSDTISVGELLS